jgi:hypothetical protein
MVSTSTVSLAARPWEWWSIFAGLGSRRLVKGFSVFFDALRRDCTETVLLLLLLLISPANRCRVGKIGRGRRCDVERTGSRGSRTMRFSSH